MPITNRYYGGSSIGAGGTVLDFGLSDLTGNYTHTSKLRTKGILIVSFFDMNSPVTQSFLQFTKQKLEQIASNKLAAIFVTDGDRTNLASRVKDEGISETLVLIDHNFYQARQWGINNLPSTYLIDGKTGQVVERIVGANQDELTHLFDIAQKKSAMLLAEEEAAKKAAEEKKAAESANKS